MLDKIDELQELYAMETDPLIIIARNYKWSVTRMQNWFSEPDSKRFEWGLEFNPALAERHPEINCSLPDQHGGYCPICYDELGEANSFCMEC